MNRDQMEYRCKEAHLLAKGYLLGYELNFCGNRNGNNYATVIEKKGAKTPVLLWATSEMDELFLDRYEGYPSFYRKEMISSNKLEITEWYGKKKFDEAYIYIMNSDHLGVPYVGYYIGIMDAYTEFGLDVSYLKAAYERCKAK